MVQEIPTMMEEQLSALPFPNYEKLLADAAKADSTEIMTKINAALARIDAVTTCEEAWKLWGELINEGYATSYGINLFSKNGHIGVLLWPKGSDYAPISNTIDKKSLQWQLISNPDLLASIRPLKGAGSRRAFDHDKWPMLTTIFTELGFNLDDAYSIEAHPNVGPENIDCRGGARLVGDYERDVVASLVLHFRRDSRRAEPLCGADSALHCSAS